MNEPMSMAGYTKLFSSILASTIWREDDKTRIVWITLLAMADKNGVAEGSIPGLADMARVSIPDCEAALKKLSSPDPYSRTKDNEGRRIQDCDGGWFLLNHGKFREKMSADERREYNRLKQEEWRRKNVKKVSTVVIDNNQMSALSAHTEAEAEAVDKDVALLPTTSDLKDVFDAWNENPLFPKCLVLSDKRRRTLSIRLKDEFFAANWREALKKISSSKFCLGNNDRGWRSSFDWFIQPDVVAKIMEGKYENCGTNHSKSSSQSANRNTGTLNEGKSAMYRGVGKVV